MQDQGFPPQCQDGTLKSTSALSIWAEKIVSALGIFGKELAAPSYKQYMIDAGFVDVVEVQYIWPQNTWPKDKKLKELGRWHLANSLDGLEGFSMALCTRAHGMTTEEVQLLMMDVRKDMKNKSIHAYWPSRLLFNHSMTSLVELIVDSVLCLWAETCVLREGLIWMRDTRLVQHCSAWKSRSPYMCR